MLKKVLVTGGAGFIGSHVADELVNSGAEVIVLDDLSGGFEDNINKKAIFVKGSVTDTDLVNSIFKNHKFDYVFHLAAYAAEGLSHFIKKYNYENNLIGSINLINASVNNNVKCFVFTSSIAVYGKNQLPMTEDMVPSPEDSYGIAKYSVEQELKASKHMFGLDYVIFRPHNVYGERQNIADKYRNVVGIFMNQAMTGQPMTIFGDGEQTRAFSYIGDVAPVIAKAPMVPEAYGGVFNIGADVPYTVNHLAKEVSAVMGVKPVIKHLSTRNEVAHAYSDHSKIRNVFGSCAQSDLCSGLSRMAKWAIKVGARESVRFQGIEIVKNIPPSWK